VCTNPQTPALLALMLFHAARFDARLDTDGGILLLEDQDRSRWDTERIARAAFYLGESAAGIAAIEEATRLEALKHYHILDATLGELHLRAGRPERARAHFRAAMEGTLSQAEKRLLARKMTDCDTFSVPTTKEGHHANGRGHAAGVSAGSHHHATHARAGAQ